MPLNTENNFWQINLLLLTAFVESYGTSVTGNMCVASQRITVYQVNATFVVNLNISQKSHCIFSCEVTQFTSSNKEERRTALNLARLAAQQILQHNLLMNYLKHGVIQLTFLYGV